MKVAGLFSGIGGLELGFAQSGFETVLMCEIDETCRAVLTHRFKDVRIDSDVRQLAQLPRVDLLVAGFPCQPYSQAGPTLGLPAGKALLKEIVRLIRSAKSPPRYVVLENVKNILHLAKGEALRAITRDFESLGYTWAYRLVDTHAFGIPQRRQRWIFVASLNDHAPSILFGDEPAIKSGRHNRPLTHGFYWTEGNRGLGWADDAIPPLKTGSTIGIPSPPAIWIRSKRSVETPHICDAERLQGLPHGWTDIRSASKLHRYERYRWKMVGNAVSVPIAQWIGKRIKATHPNIDFTGKPFSKAGPWPKAAWGSKGYRYAVAYDCFHPREPMMPLLQFLEEPTAPLSLRATQGFRERLQQSSLRYPPEFMADLLLHEQRLSAYRSS